VLAFSKPATSSEEEQLSLAFQGGKQSKGIAVACLEKRQAPARQHVA
jgi:predicted Na+-dependent transporter